MPGVLIHLRTRIFAQVWWNNGLGGIESLRDTVAPFGFLSATA